MGSLLIAMAMLMCGRSMHAARAGQSPRRSIIQPQLVLQRGLQSQAEALAFSADNRLLASVERGGNVKLWDIRSGELLRSIIVDGSWSIQVAFSPDGAVVAPYVRSGRALLYDTRTGRLLRVLVHGSEPAEIAFSPDGKTLALGGHDASLSLWDYRSGRRLRSIRVHEDEMGEVKVIAFSSNGALLATSAAVGFGSHKLELWKVASGEIAGTLETSGEIHAAAFSPDGRTLALGVGSWLGDKPAVELWDIAGRKIWKRLKGHRFDIISLAFSRDGSALSSGDAQGILKRWDVATGVAVHSVGEEDFHIKVAVSPDASMGVAPNREGSLRVYDLNGSRLQRRIPGDAVQMASVAFTIDGATLFQAGVLALDSKPGGADAGQVAVWNTRTGNWTGHVLTGEADVDHIAVGAGGTLAVTAGSSGTLQRWDLGQRRVRILLQDRDRRFLAVALSPDGSLIAVGGDRKKQQAAGARPTSGRARRPGDDEDPLLELYNVRTGQRIKSLSGHHALVNAVQFTADGGTLMSGGYDGTILLWDVRTGKVRQKIDVRTANVPECAAISQDGHIIAVGYEYQAVGLYDGRTGHQLRSLSLPSQITESIRFSPDGRLVAAGGGDGIVRVWEVATGRLLHALDAQTSYVRQVAFSSSGRLVASLDAHGTLRLWDPVGGRLQATLVLLASSAQEPPTLEWLAYTPAGYYEGSRGAEAFLRWRVGGTLQTTPSLLATYRRPDLVQTALAGHPLPALAARLGQGEQALRTTVQQDAAAILRARTAEANPPVPPPTPTDALRKALTTVNMLGDPEIQARVEAQIKAQLKAGAAPNTQGGWGTSALMFFCATGNKEEVQKLLARKVDVNRVDFYGGTALTHAAYAGRDDLIKALLEAGADLKDQDGHSLLALRGDRAGLSAALLRIMTRTSNPLTDGPSKFEPVDTAYILLYLGADPNARDAEGRTPLLLLADSNLSDSSLLRALLARGADVNARDKKGNTLLLAAVPNGDMAVVQRLIEHGAQVNLADETGMTPLMAAATRGRAEIVKLLLEKGANPNAALSAKDDGRTALMCTVDLDIMRLLLDHGADVNARSRYDNWSALTDAVARQDKAAVQLLLARGADVRVRTKAGKTLLQLLKEYDPTDKFGVGALLKNAGAP